MSHPYGVAVFENYVYWTDWNFKSIHRADKFTGNNSLTLLSNLPIQPYDIKVYSPLRQPPGNSSVLKKPKLKAVYSSLWKPIAELQSLTCRMGSHSVTCHPTQVNAPRLNPGQTGR